MRVLPTRNLWTRTPRHHQAGFVISLEFLLVSSIFIIVVVMAIAVLQQWITTQMAQSSQRTVLLADADGQPIGAALSFDEAEVPQVLFLDPDTRHAILLGVRKEHFASRHDLFFMSPDCRGNAYLMAPSSSEEPVSELQNLQGAAYAVGAGNVLWRSIDGSLPSTLVPQSRWSSRRGEVAACEPLTDEPIARLVDARPAADLSTLYRPPYSVVPYV